VKALIGIIEATIRDKIVSCLKELGLSTHEALIYLMLLTHPSATANILCRETGIRDSKIYYALDGLSKKGMILVQQGNPSVYYAIPPKEAIANLKQELKQKLIDSLSEKIRKADIMVNQLSLMYDSAEKPEELELAYIIRGQKNIVKRMKELIRASRHEVTVFVPFPSVLREISESLIEAKEKRKVKLNIGVTQEVVETERLSELGEVRLVCCALGMLVSDMKTLLTLTSWTNEVAVMTQDQNLMRVCRDYYDNPACCRKINQS